MYPMGYIFVIKYGVIWWITMHPLDLSWFGQGNYYIYPHLYSSSVCGLVSLVFTTLKNLHQKSDNSPKILMKSTKNLSGLVLTFFHWFARTLLTCCVFVVSVESSTGEAPTWKDVLILNRRLQYTSQFLINRDWTILNLGKLKLLLNLYLIQLKVRSRFGLSNLNVVLVFPCSDPVLHPVSDPFLNYFSITFALRLYSIIYLWRDIWCNKAGFVSRQPELTNVTCLA